MSLQETEHKDIEKIEELELQNAKVTSLIDSAYPSSGPIKEVVAKGYSIDEAEEAYWFFAENKKK